MWNLRNTRRAGTPADVEDARQALAHLAQVSERDQAETDAYLSANAAAAAALSKISAFQEIKVREAIA